MLFIVVLMLSCLLHADGELNWEQTVGCRTPCKCLWSQGKKAAECNNASLWTLPANLSTELQLLTLNYNELGNLTENAFFNSKLIHLNKLFLQHAGLRYIDKNALYGLSQLIEIDLSHNQIKYLHRELFRPCEKIRQIIVAHNPITKIEPGLFINFVFLQRVDFSGCQIGEVCLGAFQLLPSLQMIELRENRLSTMELDVVQHLPKLSYLGLINNPWQCNCSLRPLRDWVVDKKRTLYLWGTTCDNLQKEWKEVLPEQFACPPEIPKVLRDASGVLACLASGDPPPVVQWMFNSRPVVNHSSAEYLVTTDSRGWYNLTVRKSTTRESGEYTCVAKNTAGTVYKGLDVRFSGYGEDDDALFAGGSAMFDVWPVILGVSIFALVLIVIVLVICCVCKRQRNAAAKKDKAGQSEMEEKTLMNAVNPVQKPPRRPDTSLHSSETELLDSAIHPYTENGSILGSIQSDGLTPTQTKSPPRDADSADPPDLLAFPLKPTTHSSPVDNFPPLRHKVLTSPQFGTLPYARSRSPFAAPVSSPAVVVPRAGYVTIPRRPRVPSWTASLSPVLVSPAEDDTSFKEPIYDNLGLRTTADGSSKLSLNKGELASPPAPGYPRQSWARTPDPDERASLITSPQPVKIVGQKKTPPNPPPKPKKKLGKGLFEDEGEDGTEV